MEYIIIALSLTTGIFGFTTVRLMRRVETMEDYVTEVEKSNDEYFKFFSQLKKHVTDSYSHLKNIDRLWVLQILKMLKMVLLENYLH